MKETITVGEKEFYKLKESAGNYIKTLDLDQAEKFTTMFKDLILYIRACDRCGIHAFNKQYKKEIEAILNK